MSSSTAVFAGALLEFSYPVAEHAVLWLAVVTVKVSICIALAALLNKAIFRYTTPVIRRDLWSYTPYATVVCFLFMLSSYHFVSLHVGPYTLPHSSPAMSAPAPAFGQRNQRGFSTSRAPDVTKGDTTGSRVLTQGQVVPANQSAPQDSNLQTPDAVGVAAFGLVVVWISGVLFCGLRIAAGLRRLKIIQRDARPVDAESPAGKVIGSVLERMPKNVTYSVLFSNAVAVPLMWGHRKTTILLPLKAEDWSEERLICAIIHEAVHASGLDWPAEYHASLSCAALWFNPLVWFAKRMHRAESERVADSMVLLAIPPVDYAAHLLEIARTLQDRRSGPPAQAVAMARSANLAARVEAILSPNGAYIRLTPAKKKLRTAIYYVLYCIIFIVTYPHIIVRGAPAASNAQFPAASSTSAGTAPFAASITVAAPGASSVTLPNGATVTLVGVRDTQKIMGHSRLDNNNPMTRRWGSLASAANAPFQNLPYGAFGRAFVVMTRTKLSDQPSHAWDKPPDYPYYLKDSELPAGDFAPVSGYSWQITPHPYFAPLKTYAANPETSDSGGIVTGFVEAPQEFRATDRTCTLCYGVAAGHWKDITWLNNQAGTVSFNMSEGTITSTLIPDASKINSHAGESGKALIKVTDPFSRYSPRETLLFPKVCSYQRVLVALNHNHAHAIYNVICSTTIDSQGNVTQIGSVPNSVLKHTNCFLLAARPYEWAEFRNVPLQLR